MVKSTVSFHLISNLLKLGTISWIISSRRDCDGEHKKYVVTKYIFYIFRISSDKFIHKKLNFLWSRSVMIYSFFVVFCAYSYSWDCLGCSSMLNYLIGWVWGILQGDSKKRFFFTIPNFVAVELARNMAYRADFWSRMTFMWTSDLNIFLTSGLFKKFKFSQT